ncbi:hypothetical protein QYM36_015378 [Artemia franciscana]|uniref:E3 ubiquitin-protein ligase n=1 Tax=Artemia franciscana TaxID=6661 RepID=A0AA88HMM5_ARTSF|nr:hypothetical protein QYM36_015378 [Artemia franciscana]
MEPLATIGQLEKHLLKMVAKQWYDAERSQLNFVKRLKEGPPVTFWPNSDFNQNGIIYWIGTNRKTVSDWRQESEPEPPIEEEMPSDLMGVATFLQQLYIFSNDEIHELGIRVSKCNGWDDEFVLKRQFSASIPTFDPRSERINVHQASDIEIPTPGYEATEQEMAIDDQATKLRLVLKGPGYPGSPEIELPLYTDRWSNFKACQQLMNKTPSSRQDKMRKIWEPNYTITYSERQESEPEPPMEEELLTDLMGVITVLQQLYILSNEEIHELGVGADDFGSNRQNIELTNEYGY